MGFSWTAAALYRRVRRLGKILHFLMGLADLLAQRLDASTDGFGLAGASASGFLATADSAGKRMRLCWRSGERNELRRARNAFMGLPIEWRPSPPPERQL